MRNATSLGATGAGSPAELAAQVDTVISIVPNDDVATTVVHDATTGLLGSLREGGTHVSCSTISPQTSRALASAHADRGQRYVASPIFARPDGVESRTGTFVLSGDESAIEEVEPLLASTVSGTYRFGSDPGAANVVKLSGNFMIAAAIEAMGEALALAEGNGVSRTAVMGMLSETIFDCLIYRGYGQRVSERDHKAGGFSLDLGHKDVSLVQRAGRNVGVPMPVASLLQDRYLAALSKGRGDLDWSALGLTATEDAGIPVQGFIETARAGRVPDK